MRINSYLHKLASASRLLTSCAVASVLLFSSCASTQQRPKNGDILFVPSEGSEFDNAISDATSRGDISFTHCAFYYRGNVIEAIPDGGVIMQSYASWTKANPNHTVKSVPHIDAPSSAENMLAHLGEEYDFLYTLDNGRMYCSELLQCCIVDSLGTPLLPTISMNFLDSDGQLPSFWRDLFDAAGTPVPQGEPGTNPTQLFLYLSEF